MTQAAHAGRKRTGRSRSPSDHSTGIQGGGKPAREAKQLEGHPVIPHAGKTRCAHRLSEQREEQGELALQGVGGKGQVEIDDLVGEQVMQRKGTPDFVRVSVIGIRSTSRGRSESLRDGIRARSDGESGGKLIRTKGARITQRAVFLFVAEPGHEGGQPRRFLRRIPRLLLPVGTDDESEPVRVGEEVACSAFSRKRGSAARRSFSSAMVAENSSEPMGSMPCTHPLRARP